MATKLERQKEFVGYHTTHDTCGGCKHFTSEKKLAPWMAKSNEAGRNRYTAELNGHETSLKCTLHGFAVKKTAACNNFEGK